ncbi:MAG: sulfite exporter TauE/SafE family protein [Rhizobacter sp.]|nr:sulfite exporter TauE/SafE family protein [Rhizobacter sp.]
MPQDATLLALVALIFALAGWVKGVVGMGLPTVAMGALGLVMAPAQAAALLVVPSLVTNVWQGLAGPALPALLRRLGTMMVGVCVGTVFGIGFLTSGSSRWPSIALGSVLAIYGLAGLYLPRLSVPTRLQSMLSPAVGFATGVLTGATGVFAIPAVPYLSAIGLSNEELIQALGLSFTVSTAALAVGLYAAGSYSGGIAMQSSIAVLPALAGMALGQAVRHRLDAEVFRRWFFSAMIMVGIVMVARAAGMN